MKRFFFALSATLVITACAHAQVLRVIGISEAFDAPDLSLETLHDFAAALRNAEELPKEERTALADMLTGSWATEYAAETIWTPVGPADHAISTALFGALLTEEAAQFALRRAAAEALLDQRVIEELDGTWLTRWQELRRRDRRARWLPAIRSGHLPSHAFRLMQIAELGEDLFAESTWSDATRAALAPAERELDDALVRLAVEWPKTKAANYETSAHWAERSRDEFIARAQEEYEALRRPTGVIWNAAKRLRAQLAGEEAARLDTLLSRHFCPELADSRVTDLCCEAELDRATEEAVVAFLTDLRSATMRERASLERRYLDRMVRSIDARMRGEPDPDPELDPDAPRDMARYAKELRRTRGISDADGEAFDAMALQLRELERRQVRRIGEILAMNGITPTPTTRIALLWAEMKEASE